MVDFIPPGTQFAVSPEREEQLKQKSNEITLISWSVIKVLIDLYESDLGMPAVGDSSAKTGDVANKKNHFRLALISHANMLSRYRANTEDPSLRAMLLPKLMQPFMDHTAQDGISVIPDLNLCRDQPVAREISAAYGASIYTAPYTFQIMRS